MAKERKAYERSILDDGQVMVPSRTLAVPLRYEGESSGVTGTGSTAGEPGVTPTITMSDQRSRRVIPACLVLGAVFGVAGTFVASASLRGLLWGVDGIALIGATALLALHHLRQGHDVVAAGFLVFVAGETLILASSAMDLVPGSPLFGAGAGLWAASLILVSVPRVMPSWIRAVAAVGALLFLVVALQIFSGRPVTALSRPLPFFAYPFLAATLLGWAWRHYRDVD